jgi:protein TonB
MLPEKKQTLDDMVFENRNKEYGSYWLRKKNNIMLAIGFASSMVFVLVLILSYFWYVNVSGDANVYLYNSSLPYLKSTSTSLLSQEELSSFMDKEPPPPEVTDQPDMNDRPKTPSVTAFVVTDNADPDTFKPIQDAVEPENDGLGLINDSTAYGGLVSGNGEGFGSGSFDRLPEFSEGNPTRYVEANLRYPATAIKQKIYGIVLVSFIVNKSGHVTDVKVERGINPIIDAEAVKTIKSMPAWRPGMRHGKPVNFLLTIRVNFVPLS